MLSLAPHVYGHGVLRVRHAGDAGQRAREAVPCVPGSRVSAAAGLSMDRGLRRLSLRPPAFPRNQRLEAHTGFKLQRRGACFATPLPGTPSPCDPPTPACPLPGCGTACFFRSPWQRLVRPPGCLSLFPGAVEAAGLWRERRRGGRSAWAPGPRNGRRAAAWPSSGRCRGAGLRDSRADGGV